MATKKGISKVIKSGFLYPYKDWKSRVAVWKFVRDIPLEENHPTKKFLKQTEELLDQLSNTPVLACWGMRDFCFHSGFLQEWKKRLPHLEPYPLNDAGHYLLEDDFENCRGKSHLFFLSKNIDHLQFPLIDAEFKSWKLQNVNFVAGKKEEVM